MKIHSKLRVILNIQNRCLKIETESIFLLCGGNNQTQACSSHLYTAAAPANHSSVTAYNVKSTSLMNPQWSRQKTAPET